MIEQLTLIKWKRSRQFIPKSLWLFAQLKTKLKLTTLNCLFHLIIKDYLAEYKSGIFCRLKSECLNSFSEKVSGISHPTFAKVKSAERNIRVKSCLRLQYKPTRQVVTYFSFILLSKFETKFNIKIYLRHLLFW